MLSGPEPPAAKASDVAAASSPARADPVRVAAVPAPVAGGEPHVGSFEALVAGLGQEEPPRYAEFMRPANLATLTTKELSALVDLGTSLLSDGGSDEIRQRLGRVHHRLGMLYQAESALSQAFVNFSTAIELDPKQPEFLFSRANVFARTQRYDAAGADLDAAIALDPRRGDLHWAKGVIYLLASRTPGGVDRLNAAIQAFDAAIACDPRIAKYFSSRGAAYIRLGDQTAARLDLDTALQLDPLDAATYYNRSHLLRRQGDEPGAERDLRRAAELGSAEAAAELRKLGLPGGVVWQ
jgi:tetratricopeptide (TPR) repeat protein